jgi:hypothetical protein
MRGTRPVSLLDLEVIQAVSRALRRLADAGHLLIGVIFGHGQARQGRAWIVDHRRDEHQEALRRIGFPGQRLRLAPWPTTTAPPRAARSPMP